eukprot:7383358-Lingulodinium_polyedra.AAC.1
MAWSERSCLHFWSTRQVWASLAVTATKSTALLVSRPRCVSPFGSSRMRFHLQASRRSRAAFSASCGVRGAP